MLILVCREYALCQCTRLKEGEAEQYRAHHASPNCFYGVITCCDGLNKYRINANAHHDKETLKCEGKQSFEVVVSHIPLLARHRSNRDCSKRGHE